jgi:uncharacterized tellurite resistance protein B-like protein
MSVFESIRAVLGLDKADEGASDQPLQANDTRIAAAALGIHVIAVDGVVEDVERDRLRRALGQHFDLTEDQTVALIEEAKKADREAVDHYAFTSVLNRHMDEEGRLQVVQLLWEMAYADGAVHEFDDNALWRIAELLHVPARERIRLRKMVEGQAGDV